MKSSIKQRLLEGRIVRAMCLASLASPKLVEVAGLIGGLHGIWIDQEHSAVPHQQLELLLMACRAAGLDGFARVPPTDYATMMRPMEAGASGVMAAMVRNVDQVRQIVQWAKYPPLGTRGLFQSNYEAGYGTAEVAQHVERSNRERWLAIQIETPEAVDCVETIAAVPEVDWLFVGPSDLACTLGVPGQPLHPRSLAATARVAAACKSAGKPWGTLARSPEHAARCRELGCQFFSLVGDMELVHRGFQVTKNMYADYFGIQE
jgi:2-keto-3-deoxy-L-rhamnonate aldolase RhmA